MVDRRFVAALLLVCARLGLVASSEATQLQPRPRIHVYDLPDEFGGDCHWFSCGLLTQRIRKSKVKMQPHFFLPLHSPTHSSDQHSHPRLPRSTLSPIRTRRTSSGSPCMRVACTKLTPCNFTATPPGKRCLTAAAAACPQLPRAPLPLSQLPAKDNEMAGRMYSYIARTWPYWNRSVRGPQGEPLQQAAIGVPRLAAACDAPPRARVVQRRGAEPASESGAPVFCCCFIIVMHVARSSLFCPAALCGAQIEAQQVRHFVGLVCDHGPGCATGPASHVALPSPPPLITSASFAFSSPLFAHGRACSRAVLPAATRPICIILTVSCRDCDYINREKNRRGGYPAEWGPVETKRVVGHIMWNGARASAPQPEGHARSPAVCSAAREIYTDHSF